MLVEDDRRHAEWIQRELDEADEQADRLEILRRRAEHQRGHGRRICFERLLVVGALFAVWALAAFAWFR